MVDPIAVAEKIVEAAIAIHGMAKEVKEFKDRARELSDEIELLEPSIQVLVDMKNQRDQLIAAQKDNQQLHLFTKALNDLAICVEEIKLFIAKQKDITFFKKFWKKDEIKEKYKQFSSTIEKLKDTIKFAVLVDLASRKGKPTIQSFLELLNEEEDTDVDNMDNDLKVEQAKRNDKFKGFLADRLKPQDSDILMESDINVDVSLKHGSGMIHRVTFKKLYKKQSEATMKQVASFDRQDFDTLKRLSHDNVAQVFGLVQGKMKATYLLREYAPTTLQDHLLEMTNPICPQLLRQWTRESAEAVKYLHKEELVVGNIRASNCLLFLHEGRLKLSDFGLKRKLDVEITSCFMAPELSKGEALSTESDMFDFGMLVLEMVKGEKHPNNRDLDDDMNNQDLEDDMFQVVNDRFKIKVPNDVKIPKNFKHLMYRCMRSSPTSRPTASHALKIIAGPEEPTELAIESCIKVNQSSSEQGRIDIVIQLKDESGADVKTDNKTAIQGNVYTTSSENEQLKIIETDEGIKAHFTPKHIGKYKIVVQIHGDTVGNCPYDYYHLREMKHKRVTHYNTSPKGLNKPHDIKVFNDRYIIADTFNHRLLTTNHNFTDVKELQKSSSNDKFKPYGIAIVGKRIFVTDNCPPPGRVVVYEDGGNGKLWEFGYQELQRPTGIAAFRKKIYVIDFGLNCIKVYDISEINATCIYTISQPGSGPHDLNRPWLATLNSKGQLLVADCRNKRIQIFDLERSNRIRAISVNLEGTPLLPRGIAVDSDNNIYVTVMAFTGFKLAPCLQCVVVFNEEGQCIGNFGSRDRLSWPRGIAVISDNNDSKQLTKVFITSNHTITEYGIC